MIITCCSCKTQIDFDLGIKKGWKRESLFARNMFLKTFVISDKEITQRFNLKILCPECIIIKDIIE
jgi:hypothetical protein